MLYARLADLVLTLHFAFILFVFVGSLAVLRWPRLVFLHIPCLLYGAAIQFVGWLCPLTPLEQRLRLLAGQEGYQGGFIEHYVGRVVYPANWETMHVWLGLALVAFNILVYGLLARRLARRSQVAGR